MKRPIFAMLVVATAALIVDGRSAAQPDAAVDAYLRDELARQRIPGLSIAVVKDGRVIKAAGYGLANVELNVAATADTIYQSGSMGKQFTATAVMLLVEDGKLRLDERIDKYLPGVPNTWHAITIRHLLTHTSGLANDFPMTEYRNDYTEDELLKRVGEVPLEFQPGEKWSYSNLAYKVLGILVSKVSGKFYGDFLHERVFAPLEMTTTRIISEADIVPNRASGYRLEGDVLKNQEWVSPSMNTTGDGSLYLTVYDLAKWDAALYSERVLKRSSLQQMWTPVKLNDGTTAPYGFGWAIDALNGHREIGHSGAWQGFVTDIARFVDDHLTVVVLANRAGANVGRIAERVAGLYDADLAPKPRQKVAVDPKVLDDYVGEYQIEPEATLKVSRTGSTLIAQVADRPPIEFTASSPTEFYNEDGPEITFVRDEKGVVTHLLVGRAHRVVPKIK